LKGAMDCRKRILIAGYYGLGNTGDEAILAAMLEHLLDLDPDLQFTVLSRDPQATSNQYGVQSIHMDDLEGRLRAVASCNLVIVGGGGIINDGRIFGEGHEYLPENLLTGDSDLNGVFLGLPILAKLYGKPCMVYAVGVGPLHSPRIKEHVRDVFRLVSAATVRDTASKDLLLQIGCQPADVQVTADPAFGLSPAPSERAQEILAGAISPICHPLVAVSLRPWSLGAVCVWEERVALALDEFGRRHDGSLLFIPFYCGRDGRVDHESNDDIACADRVMAKVKNVPVARLGAELSAKERAAVIAQCDLTVGMRLHSVIFSITAGTPCVAISYSQKVRSVMLQAGCDDLVVDVESLSAERLVELMEHAVTNRVSIGPRLLGVGDRLRSLARDNAVVAERLLTTLPSYPSPTLGEERLWRELVLNLVTRSANLEAELKRLATEEASLKAELKSIHDSRRWRLVTRLAAWYWKIRKLLPLHWVGD